MTSPRRLLEDDPGIARLVDALRKDGPSETRMDSLLSMATRAAEQPLSRAPASSWFAGPSRIGLAAMGAIALVSMVTITSRFGSTPEATTSNHAVVDSRSPAASPTSVGPLRAPNTPSPSTSSPSTTLAEGEDQPSVLPAAEAATPAKGVARATATSVSTRSVPKPSPSFEQELALIAEARAALKRDDTAACLDAVARHARTFRHGVFVQEVDVIRIEALAKSGASDEARTAAERFLATNAGSPYEDRVRSVLQNTH